MPTGQADMQEDLVGGSQDIPEIRAPKGLYTTFATLFDFPEDVEDLEWIEDPEEDRDDVEEDVEVKQSLKDLEPTSVLYILEDLLGEAWWQLSQNTLLLSLGEVITYDEADRNIIYALQTMFSHSGFWTEWEIFNWVTRACDTCVTDFSNFSMLEPEDMLVSMLTATFVAKLQGSKADYAPEVISYIAANCMMRGVWALPFPLSLAQDRVVELMSLHGWELPPLAEIQEKAYQEEYSKDPTTDLDAQAAWYRYLVDFRASRLKESRREIQAYRRRGKV